MRTPVPRSHLALAAVAVAASTAGAPGVAQTPSRERTLYVSAVDAKGEPVEGLDADAFVVREDGVRREVLRVSKATEPMDIALLVDNSTAMSDELTFFRESLSKFVARMAPGNQMAIVTLGDRPTIAVEYTGDLKRLTDGARRLFPMPQSGMTLLDGIAEVSQGLGKRETPRAVLVAVVTDGVEFTNRYSRDVVAALRRAGAALHIVGVGRFIHSEEHGIRERSLLLNDGPRDSGGEQTTLLSPTGLEPAMMRLARELSSQYKVVYARPESLIPPERVTVAPARPGVTMRGTPARREGGDPR
jgi:VWFA-related protein